MDQLRFDGRVAVVTGAGGGLGREYALLLAARGAKVVVNDLGGGRDGAGKSKFADAVVKEIQDKGGVAVADYYSVVEGDKIIGTALKHFGRIDILINNAGILRDKSFAKMSDQDWELVQAVHVKGAMRCTQAAWEHFRAQRYGRVVMTSSNAGLLGNFGQANYSAAKMALVGLAATLAIEGAKYGVRVNTIVPTAASRLTQDILPPDMFAAMRPALVAPVVAYMVHEEFAGSGLVIDSTLGFAARTRLVRAPAASLRDAPGAPVTPESVRAHWPEVVDMSRAVHFDKISDVTLDLVSRQAELEARAAWAEGRDAYYTTYEYTNKDVALYALGVGARADREDELRFVYESHERFGALPSFFILAGMCMESPLLGRCLPAGRRADFTNILHGEQYIEFVGAYPPPEATLDVRCRVDAVLDKGSSAVAVLTSDVYQAGAHLFRTQQHVFVVGQGGWGGPRASERAVPVQAAPARAPDAVTEQATDRSQAALYRLSGDLNPLHIDAGVAAAAGHARPILHGLASLGFAVRHVLERFGGNEPANVACIKARFSAPVTPGHALATAMWLEGRRVHFTLTNKDSGKVAISGAYMDLKAVVSGAGPGAAPAAAGGAGGAARRSDGLFERIKAEVAREPARARAIGGVFLYNVTHDGATVKQWTLDLKTPEVYPGSPRAGAADTTLTVAEADLLDMAAGALSPQVAYLKGKLKIAGNIMLAQKLGPLLKQEAKL